MLYLVTGYVRSKEYMKENSMTESITRLVDADSVAEAEVKFDNFYRAKSDEYAIYYSTEQVTATETII
jgi:hypothetical protein